MKLGALVAMVVVAGCGDDGVPAVDAGRDSSLDASSVFMPDPPTPPAIVMMTPCPAGWVEEPPSDPTAPATCRPFTDPPPTCADDEVLLPGEGCVRVGSDCAADGWPTMLPAATTLYVREGATGGDGTRALPFAMLGEAVGVATAGATIALARGSYGPEDVLVERDIEIVGACTAGTIQRGRGGIRAAIRVRGDVTAHVRDLTLEDSGGDRTLRAEDGGIAVVERVLHVGGGLIAQNDGHIRVTTALVHRARGAFTDGVVALGSSDLQLSRVQVRDNLGRGVALFEGTSARVEDSTLSDLAGTGASASAAILEMERSAVSETTEVAVFGLDDAQLTIRDSWLADIQPDPMDSIAGAGIAIVQGSTVVAERVLVEDGAVLGSIVGTGSSATLSDFVIRRTRPREADGLLGRALEVGQTSTMDATRLHLADNAEMGLFAHGIGTRVTAADVVIARTAPVAVGVYGRAIHVQDGAAFTATRMDLVDNHEATLTASSPGTMVMLTDAAIRGTLERGCASTTCADAAAGIGVGLRLEANVQLERFALDGHALAGLQLAGGGTADFREGVVSNNPIGANLQDDGFDVARLMDRVVYVDNGTNLDSGMFVVPEAASPIAR